MVERKSFCGLVISENLIFISRQNLELGRLPVREAGELLRTGFLLATDEFWTETSTDRRPLSELEIFTSIARSGWLKRARTSMVTTTGAVIERAGHLTARVSGSIRRGHSLVGTVATKVLDDYTAQLRGMVATQITRTVGATKSALKDETFLRKLFGAVYDCLPKPVYRFVSEQAFIEYCFKHRRKLLD